MRLIDADELLAKYHDHRDLKRKVDEMPTAEQDAKKDPCILCKKRGNCPQKCKPKADWIRHLKRKRR